ncbi:hypothetical protein ONZ45_g2832 [Pleurotus djamor]|nr:hypothetical protein ONZ45_g2832 [Pleurotus djamor]
MPFTSFILFFNLHVYLSLAKPINVTVDDQFGVWPAFGLHQNITYGTGWFNSRLNECNNCQNSTTPTAFQHAVNGTWKRASYRGDSGKAKGKPKFATFTFNGTGVYVNIIRAPNTDTGVPGNIELLFNLDGLPTRVVDDAQSTVFLQTIFSNSSMTQREHTLTIQNGDPSGKYIQCMIFLDSIVYTTDDSLLFNIPMVPSEGPPPTALAGSKRTVGVATIVAGIGGAANQRQAVSPNFFRRASFPLGHTGEEPQFLKALSIHAAKQARYPIFNECPSHISYA